jgi:arabinose-5-phosphate isomerase
MSEARQTAERVLRAEAQAVLNVIEQLGEAFDRATAMIADCGGTLIVSGMGKSGLVARKLSATFASTGTPSHDLHPSEAMHGDLGRIRKGDALLLLSYGGETDDVLSLAALARQDGVPVISITGNGENHLAKISDVNLSVGDVTEACPHQLAPTASTTAMLALGDALALAVSEKRAFSADDFKKRHPGGSLGRLMMPITDVLRLRAGENLPLIDASKSVTEVLAMTSAGGRRVGAVLLVDGDGKLAGIFTDADLARLLVKQGADALTQTIGEVMTKNPATLPADALVRDAVQLVREKRLDELPVVDGNGKPVGLIDVQDLVGLRVIEG